MASVKLTKVKKVYDNKVVAVHDFDLDIKDKEFVDGDDLVVIYFLDFRQFHTCHTDFSFSHRGLISP